MDTNGRSTLFFTFSDMYMVKLENDNAVPCKPKFYKRYVDDMFDRRKANLNNTLFWWLKNYHPKIKQTIELNPNKFLNTKLCVSGICNIMDNRR